MGRTGGEPARSRNQGPGQSPLTRWPPSAATTLPVM